jgi:hypothetical protein
VTIWRRRLLLAWALLALIWISGIAYVCLAAWPSIPLDISANDPATRAAFARAIRMHVVRCAVLGLAPPLLLLALGWLIARLRPTRP